MRPLGFIIAAGYDPSHQNLHLYLLFALRKFSFSAYINRLRGYHADRLKAPGFGHGIIDSYYYTLPEHKMKMREYWPVSGAVYAREFPTSWRNIDQGIEELSNLPSY